jgi:diguanylate cyclase (GGDEF)-like protein
MLVRLCTCMILMVFGPAAPGQASEWSHERFEQRLVLAERLNVTAPWRESQTILDEIRPFLDRAEPDQYARFRLLEIRNLVLDGEFAAGLEQVERLLDRDLTPEIRIRAMTLAMNAAIFMRRYETIFDYLNRSLELEATLGPEPPSVGHHLSLAAYMYVHVGQFERAREYGHMNLDRAIRWGEIRDQCIAHQRLAFVYKSAEELTRAGEHYQRGLVACTEAGDELMQAVVEYAMADLLRQAGEYGQAAALFASSEERLARTDYQAGINERRLYLARLHRDLGEQEPARELLESSVEHYRQSENWNYLAEIYGMLAQFAQANGDIEQALTHLRAEMDARERFLDQDRGRHLAFLEVEFDSHLKEQELALLREKARVSELEEQTRAQQRRLQYLGYLIAVVLLIALLLLLMQVTKERRHYQRLSRHDGLTGLNNHTRFFELATTAFERTRREQRPYTLILADIDLFKRVNDLHGHRAGDEVLRRVSFRLKEIFGDIGILGRIGGEEFAISLPDREVVDVEEKIEQLRNVLRLARTEDPPIQVTISFGVGQRSDENTLSELRERVDRLLYRAKDQGRDRVIAMPAG